MIWYDRFLLVENQKHLNELMTILYFIFLLEFHLFDKISTGLSQCCIPIKSPYNRHT